MNPGHKGQVMSNYKIRIQYDSGMEVIDIRAGCSTDAICTAMDTIRRKARHLGIYRVVRTVEILQNTL